VALRRKPGAYSGLKVSHRAFFNAVEALGIAVRQAGPLEPKVTQLVQLGAAAAIRSEGAVHSHVRRALELGLSGPEIHHALIALTSTIGFPTVRAALSWADDVINAAPTGRKSARGDRAAASRRRHRVPSA
jgi:4-carboxymuconolactone decarboxylase